jgi:hypothetical protein
LQRSLELSQPDNQQTLIAPADWIFSTLSTYVKVPTTIVAISRAQEHAHICTRGKHTAMCLLRKWYTMLAAHVYTYKQRQTHSRVPVEEVVL